MDSLGNYSIHLHLQQDIKHETGLVLDIPSSASSSFGYMSTPISSRRDSSASSANSSTTTSSFGKATPYTPSSSASFEPLSRYLNTTSEVPSNCFSTPLYLDSSTADWDKSFTQQSYISPSMLCPWENSSVTDISAVQSEPYLSTDHLHLQKEVYNTRNGPMQPDPFFSSPPRTPLGLQSAYDDMMVSGQSQCSEDVSVMLPLPGYQPSSQDQQSYPQILLPQTVDHTYSLHHVYPPMIAEYSPSKTQSLAIRSNKTGNRVQSKRKQTTTKSSSKKSRSAVLNGEKIEVEFGKVIGKAKHECPWPDSNCGSFQRPEHMKRHLKSHVIDKLKQSETYSNTSTPSCWPTLWPHLTLFPDLAQKAIKKAFIHRTTIPKEVLDKAFEQFPDLSIDGDHKIPEFPCLVCKGKGLSRPDNLTQHYKTTHFTPLKTEGNKKGHIRLIKDGVMLWDEIDKYGVRDRAEYFLKKQREQELKDQGFDNATSPRKLSRNGRKTALRVSRARSSAIPSASPS